MENKLIKLNWTVGDCGKDNHTPDCMIVATVPGNIQCDFAREYNYKDVNVGDNFHQYDWMEDNYFLYEAKLPAISKNQRMIFKSLGIDYEYEILVNSKSIYHYEGMFRKALIDITDYLTGDDTLGVLIYPIPRVENPKYYGELNRTNASQSCKPAVSYGWDFHPTLVVRGIWEETGVIITECGYLDDWNIDTYLADDYSKAFGDVTVDYKGAESYKVSLEVKSPDGETVFTASSENCDSIHFEVDEPKLWWPNGYGEQPLYSFILSVEANGEITENVSFKRGFRKFELVPYEGSWDEPIIFPCPAPKAPLTFRINGKPIFIQGSNWVCPKIFTGTLTKEDYDIQLKWVKKANMNMVRSWGGAIVNKEPFFELCDEYGILVWQEFPLGCNYYDATKKYLATLKNESEAIIRRVRKHTCLALWCGGNELFMQWSMMTMQEKALRLLDSQCYLLDPDTPFIPTSPISDFVHGDYRFRNPDGRDIMQMMNGYVTSGYNEMGCGGAADMETIRYVVPEDELDRFEKGTAWETHHGINAWMKESHLYWDTIESYFGKGLNLEQVVEYSRLMQAIGYQYIYEEARRQSPRCSMVLNWCLNEPWPSVANNNILNYKGEPKPAYFAICNALRPSMPSIRYGRFDYKNGDTLKLEAWWLNQLTCDVKGKLALKLNFDGKDTLLKEITVNETAVDKNIKLFDTECVLNSEKQQLFTVTAEFTADNGETVASQYTMLYRV